MAFSIKNDETDLLLRELVALTGESLTEAVTASVRERLERQRRLCGGSKLERMMEAVTLFRALPVLDDRSADEILGYDDMGLPS
jgi:antitoxin VapB